MILVSALGQNLSFFLFWGTFIQLGGLLGQGPGLGLGPGLDNYFDLIARRKPYTGEIEINIGEASNSFSIRTRKLKLIG